MRARVARRSAPRLRAALEDMATRVDAIGEVRGLGPMLALEIVRDRDDQDAGAGARRRAPSPPPARQGLLLLACGLHGNVIRLLPPLTITDEELTRGLEILEAVAACDATHSIPSPPTSSARRPRSCGATTASASAGASRRSSCRSRTRAQPAPAREAIVVCWNRDGGAAYRAVVDLTDDVAVALGGPARASSPTSRPTSGTSATRRCAREPRLIEALAKRGITDMDAVLFDVWGYRGFLVPERYAGRRVGWTDTWYPLRARLQPVREPGQRPALRRRPQHDGAAGDRGHVRRRQAGRRDGRVRPAPRAGPEAARRPRADRDHAARRASRSRSTATR